MKKIIRLTESDLTELVKRVIKESTSEKSIIREQATFASVFPSVNMLTSRDPKTQPIMGGEDNTNIIFLTKRDAQGRVLPNTKFSYKLTGKYGFISFNITLRKVRRGQTSGILSGEVLPSNSVVRKAMQKLIGKQHLTPDGWLKIAAPAEKIDKALTQLHNNQGSVAKLSLDGGVNITLQKV